MTEQKGYPRKVLVLTVTGSLAETVVNDRLPQPLPFVFWFEPDGWVTEEMRVQAWKILKPYMVSSESPWVFSYYQGMYQAKKLHWSSVGYKSSGWSNLLMLIVECYYTYEERKLERWACELEILGRRTLNIEREEDLDLAKRIALPGSNQNFVVDEFNRAYIAYASWAVALIRKKQLERTGRFRVNMKSVSR